MMLFLWVFSSAFSASAEYFTFEDHRFQGEFTKENLDAIIAEYELFNGWYWTTEADKDQTYHGQENRPGWTHTAVEIWKHVHYLPDWYGCRWMIPRVRKYAPGKGGYGECFGFAQFIGYLLSGERNPQGRWKFYYSLKQAGGLRIGDIVRVEYQYKEKKYQHSAVVYDISEDQVTFLQTFSSSYNQISVGIGFSDGHYKDIRTLDEIAKLPYLKISRSKLNLALPPVPEQKNTPGS